MGRIKVDIKKIEDSTRSQITYSKRRNGLIKKVNELSVLCDIDIVVVTFSPSGRLTQFPKPTRLFDVLNRYRNLPVNRRDYVVEDPQALLQQLDHIYDYGTKTIFVNNQIKRYEKQVLISKLELQILEDKLRSFDRNLNTQVTLTEVQWQEAYLTSLLKQLMNRKEILFHKSKMLEPSNIQMAGAERNIANNLSMNVVPWLNPYRAQRNSFGSLLNEAMGLPIDYQFTMSNPLVSNFPSWNQFGSQFQPSWNQIGSQFQPIQNGMVNYGIAPLVPNQQLEIMASSTGTVIGDVPLAVGQQSGGTFGTYENIKELDGQENDVIPMFDHEEVKWLTNAMLNNEQNPNVSEPFISPRVSSPSIYNPMGVSLHVDPFIRVFDLNTRNNNNNNNNNPNDANTSSTPVQNNEDVLNQEDPWAELQASLEASDLSRVHIQNQEDIIAQSSNLQESSPFDPSSEDGPQLEDLRIEDMIWDDILLKNDLGENQDEDGTRNDEDLVIPDIWINLEDLGFFSE